MLKAEVASENLKYSQELFPRRGSDFDPLFVLHGKEVRGRPFELDFDRYKQIGTEGRLVWMVARSTETNKPAGYACSFWYRDLHFNERVAADDLWFVHPWHRNAGIGKTLKLMCHAELKKQGVVLIYDAI